MPKTYVFPNEFEANNLDNSTLNPNSEAYFALCAKMAQDVVAMKKENPELDFKSYDPRDVKTPEEYTTLDKVWAALLSLQEKNVRVYNMVTSHEGKNNLTEVDKYSSLMSGGMAGNAFHKAMGSQLMLFIGVYYACLPDGLSGLTPEENRMLHETLGTVVGVKEVELAENAAEANDAAPETTTVEVKLPAGTLAFFSGAAHQSGTTLFETMRNRAVELADRQNAEPGELDALKTACFNYIKGKEAERATQKGRERFKMALSMLKTLTTEDEFQTELDRINGIRAAKWFGRGGEALHAYDFDEPVAATAENEPEKAPELPADLSENTEQRGFRPELADAANAFFASAAHGKGSTRYNAMRDSVKALLSGGDLENIPAERRKAAVDACRAYINRKENERVTQSGRERFRMAMTLLHELLPANEFRQEIDRINGIRKGTPLDAAEYGTDGNISKLNAAAGKRDCYAAFEEERIELFSVLNDRKDHNRLGLAASYLAGLVTYQEQMEKNGVNAEVDEEAERRGMIQLLDLDSGGFKNVEQSGLVAVANRMVEDEGFRNEMLSEEQLKSGMPLLKEEIFKQEINVGIKNSMATLEERDPKGGKVTRNRAEDLELSLADCASVFLLAREAKASGNVAMFNVHSGAGTTAASNKYDEVRNADWFKATMEEIISPSEDKKQLLGNLSVSAIINDLKSNDPTKLLAVFDKMNSGELDREFIKKRAQDYDLRMQRKFRLDNNIVVGANTPAGQMQRALLKAEAAVSLEDRRIAAANVLAARLVCDMHMDKVTQKVVSMVSEKETIASHILGHTDPENVTDNLKLYRTVVRKAALGKKALEEFCNDVKASQNKEQLNQKMGDLVQKIDKAIADKHAKKQSKQTDKRDDAAAGASGPSVG